MLVFRVSFADPAKDSFHCWTVLYQAVFCILSPESRQALAGFCGWSHLTLLCPAPPAETTLCPPCWPSCHTLWSLPAGCAFVPAQYPPLFWLPSQGGNTSWGVWVPVAAMEHCRAGSGLWAATSTSPSWQEPLAMNAYPGDQRSSCREWCGTGTCHFFFKQLKDVCGAHCSWEAWTVVCYNLLVLHSGETRPH